MGLIFSRFYDKPSTRDSLEKIEQELQNIEERRWDKIKREQFVVQILSFIPITILIVTICILIYPSDSSWRDKLILCVPIIILNLVLLLCRKSVQWYSHWSLNNEEVRLRKLQKEKKRILEMVCETESYRVAAELLEKYDPKQLRRRDRNIERPSSPLNTTLTKYQASPNRPAPSQQSHNQSQLPSQLSFLNQSLSVPPTSFEAPNVPSQLPVAPPPTPVVKQAAKNSQLNKTVRSPLNTSVSAPTVAASSVQGRPVRPILSKDRTLFERVVDWVVADGPDNRFALICRYCYGHNGMSLAEEYETINFRCCYCYNLNTTTNKRQVIDQLQPEREKSEKAGQPVEAISEKEESEIIKDDNGNQSEDPKVKLVEEESGNKEEIVEDEEAMDTSKTPDSKGSSNKKKD